MPIIKHKWLASRNCTVIEKFYYTENGRFFSDIRTAQRCCAASEEVHEGRIILNRAEGQFFVNWSTRNMRRIASKQFDELRHELKNFMDGLRTGSLIGDIDTWTRIILWYQVQYAVKAAAALDAKGKIVRLALWDEAKKQFVPKQDFVPHCDIAYELFTEARWRQVEASCQLHEEYKKAQHCYEKAVLRFHLRENNTTYLEVLRNMRDTYREQAAILEANTLKKDREK